MNLNPRPLLVRLPNWIGDVVMTLPSLRLLASRGHRLQLVGKPWAASLLAAEPWDVATYPSGYRKRVALLKQLATAVRAEDSTLDSRLDRGADALLFPSSFSSAWEMRMAGLRTYGYRYEARGFLLTRSLPLPKRVHKLMGYWQLASSFVRQSAPPPAQIDLRLTDRAYERALELRRAHSLQDGYIVLCPFAQSELQGHSKRWPQFTQFAMLARRKWGKPLVVCPGPHEIGDARLHFPEALVLEQVDLPVYAALMRQADLVVANDTGPGHMAAAVGAPLLSVLGPTDPARYGPWGPTVRILTSPQGWPDIEQVFDAAETVLLGQRALPSALPLRAATSSS